MPSANNTCMPTQMPSTGRDAMSRRSTMRSPATDSSPRMQASYAPTPGTTSPSAFSATDGSDVSVTSAPARSTARTAERRLPDP